MLKDMTNARPTSRGLYSDRNQHLGQAQPACGQPFLLFFLFFSVNTRDNEFLILVNTQPRVGNSLK